MRLSAGLVVFSALEPATKRLNSRRNPLIRSRFTSLRRMVGQPNSMLHLQMATAMPALIKSVWEAVYFYQIRLIRGLTLCCLITKWYRPSLAIFISNFGAVKANGPAVRRCLIQIISPFF